MDWTDATLWWLAAGVAVAVELGTGTFYLLMIAVGLAAGAVSASVGFGVAAQVVVAALVSAGATALWHWRRAHHPHSAPVASNADVHLDLGAHVQVLHWTSDGCTQVTHRGSVWQARLAPGANAALGTHTIMALDGNHLVLAPLAVALPI